MEMIEVDFKPSPRKTDVIRCPYCSDSSLDGWDRTIGGWRMECGWKYKLTLPEGGGNGIVTNCGGCTRQPQSF